jgi:hypothetical protein
VALIALTHVQFAVAAGFVVGLLLLFCSITSAPHDLHAEPMDVDVELDIQFTEAMPAVVSGKGSSGHTSIVATCSKITGIKGRT